MKKICLNLSLVLLAAAAPVFAQTTAEDFMKIGNQQFLQKNYDAALAAYSECIRLKSDAAGCYQNRAVILLGKSKNEPVKPLEISVDTLMGKTNQKLNIGGSQVRNEMRLKALADVDKVVQLQPKAANAYFIRAQIYAAESIYDKAIVGFRYGLTLDAKNEFAKSELAKAEKSYAQRLGMSAGAMAVGAGFAAESGDKTKAAESYSQALDLYTKSLELDKTNDINLRGRARVYKILNNYEAAIGDYTEALRIKADDGDALIERAETYVEQKKMALALADYEKAILLPASSTNKYFIERGFIGRGSLALQAGQTDAAIADFNKALASTPEFALALFYRGRAYVIKGNKPQAIADFKKALQIVGDYPEAQAELKKLGVKP